MGIAARIIGVSQGGGPERSVAIGEGNDLNVSLHIGDPPPKDTANRIRFFSQLVSSVGDGSGITNMNATISDSDTDGVCSDHTGPTYTFTSVAGGLTGAVRLNITDTGAGGNGLIGPYDVSSVTNDNTIELTKDPTNGTNETGLDWNIPDSIVFTLSSHTDYDIHIMALVVLIGDSAVVHGSFGNVSALANGWDLSVRESGVNTAIISKAKTGGQVIIQSATSLAWGDANLSFELSNFSGTEDATVVIVPIHEFVPGGIRIGRDTSDMIRSVVNDDLTGLTQFTVRAIGYRHYP
jgi:hypothetical protein